MVWKVCPGEKCHRQWGEQSLPTNSYYSASWHLRWLNWDATSSVPQWARWAVFGFRSLTINTDVGACVQDPQGYQSSCRTTGCCWGSLASSSGVKTASHDKQFLFFIQNAMCRSQGMGCTCLSCFDPSPPTSKPHSTLSGFFITTECSISHKSPWKKDNYYHILDSLSFFFFLVFFSFLLFFLSFRNYVYGWPMGPRPKTLTISGAGVAGCWKRLMLVLVTKLRSTTVAHAFKLWVISPVPLLFYTQCW